MLFSLRGKIVSCDTDYILLQVGPVIFRVETFSERFKTDEETQVYTYLILKDNQPLLYGFQEKKELEIFKKLLEVPGVGPRTASNIVSRVSPEDLTSAIENGNPSVLLTVPGIGKKTANRLIFHLRSKEAPIVEGNEAWREALEALISLGFEKSEAIARIQKVTMEKKDLAVAEIIKEALRGWEKS